MRYTLSDFDYCLPEELIAQEPLEERSESRLMVLNRHDQSIQHYHFRDIVRFLNPDDLLILNNTKVFQARILASKKTGGRVEVLFLKKINDLTWQAMLTGTGKMRLGTEFELENASFQITKTPEENGPLIFELSVSYSGDFFQFLERHGVMPLPPYIERPCRSSHKKSDSISLFGRQGVESEVEDSDIERYQTVFAKETGAAAAPTAGFHFTEELLEDISRQGTSIEFVTLHVGYGTFSPVKEESLDDHVMHEEECEVSEETALKINSTKSRSGKVMGCGTTTLRTLESFLNKDGKISPGQKETDIFIYPPMQIKSLDALITNFHLPKSTLLMLISAFGGYDFIRRAYEEAIKKRYRFFSYGDAMLIL